MTKRGSPTWSGSLPDFRPGFGNSKHVTITEADNSLLLCRTGTAQKITNTIHASGLGLTRACRKDWLKYYHSDDCQQTSGQLNNEGATEP